MAIGREQGASNEQKKDTYYVLYLKHKVEEAGAKSIMNDSEGKESIRTVTGS